MNRPGILVDVVHAKTGTLKNLAEVCVAPSVCCKSGGERQLAGFHHRFPCMPEFSCLSCGACCAAFRVDFHCADLATAENPGVPLDLAVPLTATLFRMQGTDAASPRCAALAGEVGRQVHCTIYEQRPGPCRDFAPYAPLGIGDDACDRARRRYALLPLVL